MFSSQKKTKHDNYGSMGYSPPRSNFSGYQNVDNAFNEKSVVLELELKHGCSYVKRDTTRGWLGYVDSFSNAVTGIITSTTKIKTLMNFAIETMDYTTWKSQLRQIIAPGKRQNTHLGLAAMIRMILNPTENHNRDILGLAGVLSESINQSIMSLQTKQDILVVLCGVEKFLLKQDADKRQINIYIRSVKKALQRNVKVETDVENTTAPVSSSDSAEQKTKATENNIENQCPEPTCKHGYHWFSENDTEPCDFNLVQQPSQEKEHTTPKMK